MNYKKFLPDVLAILFFVAISMIYFLSPIRDGKVLAGHDHDAAIGSGIEMEQLPITESVPAGPIPCSLVCLPIR